MREAEWVWASETHRSPPGRWPLGASWWWIMARQKCRYNADWCRMSGPFQEKLEISSFNAGGQLKSKCSERRAQKNKPMPRRAPGIHKGKRIVSSEMVMWKLDIRTPKNETGPLPHTVHRNQLKIDRRLKQTTLNCKSPRRKRRGILVTLISAMISWGRH